LRTLPQFRDAPLALGGQGQAVGWALYAALFEPRVDTLELVFLSSGHRDGPVLLNVHRYLDLPQALAMVLGGERSVKIHGKDLVKTWAYPVAVARVLGLGKEHVEWDERKK